MRNPPSGITIPDYKAAIRAGNQTHVRIHFPVQDKTFTDANIDANGGVVVSTIGNQYESFRLGNVSETEVTIRFIMSSDFDNLDWKEEFQLFFGVEINGTNQEIRIGYFTGKRPKIDPIHGIIEFTAYDRMHKLNATVDDFLDGITSQVNMQTLFTRAGTYLGLQSIWSITTQFNFTFDVSIFNRGITFKELIGYIAEAVGGYVRITNGGVFIIQPIFIYSSGRHDLYESDCFEINVDGVDVIESKDYGVAMSSESGIVYSYPSTGSNAYVVLDNPILLNVADTDKQTILEEIVTLFNRAVLYIPYSVTMIGDWTYEVGDFVLFHTIYNPHIPTMLSSLQNITFSWNGGCEQTLEFSGADDDDDYFQQIAKDEYKQGGELEPINKKINSFVKSKRISEASATTHTINIPNDCRALIVGFGTSATTRAFASIVLANGSGAVSTLDLAKGSNVSFDTATANKLKITYNTSVTVNYLVFATTQTILDGITI